MALSNILIINKIILVLKTRQDMRNMSNKIILVIERFYAVPRVSTINGI